MYLRVVHATIYITNKHVNITVVPSLAQLQ